MSLRHFCNIVEMFYRSNLHSCDETEINKKMFCLSLKIQLRLLRLNAVVNSLFMQHKLVQSLSWLSVCVLQLIPPRGCAYVCYALRRDAARALEKLKGYKLNGNLLKVCYVCL